MAKALFGRDEEPLFLPDEPSGSAKRSTTLKKGASGDVVGAATLVLSKNSCFSSDTCVLKQLKRKSG